MNNTRDIRYFNPQPSPVQGSGHTWEYKAGRPGLVCLNCGEKAPDAIVVTPTGDTVVHEPKTTCPKPARSPTG